MAKNDFKPFATGARANTTPQADWENLPALQDGFTAGKASSAQINKAVRQPSTIAALIGQFIANSGSDALDDGDVPGLVTKFTNAITKNLSLGEASKLGTATQAETDAGTRDDVVITPKKLVAWVKQASETVQGMAKVASQAEVNAGADDTKFVTAKKLMAWVKQASETVQGMMKVATQAQTDAGTADDVVVTPKKLMAALKNDIAANGCPAGTPIPWPLATPPVGFLMMMGQPFNKTTYPKLAAVYPSGVLPDLRGEFIRGWDNGRGVDTGRALLSGQSDALLNHRHNSVGMDRDSRGGNYTLPNEQYPILGKGFSTTAPDYSEPMSNSGVNCATGLIKTQYTGAIDVSRIGAETRPRNIAFNYIVRAA